MTKMVIEMQLRIAEFVERAMQQEEGQGLIEYALIAGLIAVACVAVMKVLSTNIQDLFTSVSTTLSGA